MPLSSIIIAIVAGILLIAAVIAAVYFISEARFKNLAAEIFAARTKEMNDFFAARTTELGKLNAGEITSLVAPMRTLLESFSKQAAQNHSDYASHVALITDGFKRMTEASAKVAESASSLTAAFKGGSSQQVGALGELILQTTLENAGLVLGQQFETQVALHDDAGSSLRADAVIHLPDNRDVIIDSKMTAPAILEYADAATQKERDAAAKRIVVSVENHIKEIIAKKYPQHLKVEGRETYPLTVMFIPNEIPYTVLQREKPELITYAFSHGVLITTPVNLVALLSFFDIFWKREARERNKEEIFDTARLLLDRLQLFVADFEHFGKALTTAQNDYEAMRRLLDREQSKSIPATAERLIALGVSPTGKRTSDKSK